MLIQFADLEGHALYIDTSKVESITYDDEYTCSQNYQKYMSNVSLAGGICIAVNGIPEDIYKVINKSILTMERKDGKS